MADIESLKQENRIFPPPADFVQNATISGMDAYNAMCAEAEQDYEGFWAKLARENIEWKRPFTKTLDESNAPFYKWFEDGQLNVSYNCLDRNL
ncbi:MAG: acetyl-coenzyme A synthetase N-terminal domain-containing protein, partial [Burkholderiaceae bacterium]